MLFSLFRSCLGILFWSCSHLEQTHWGWQYYDHNVWRPERGKADAVYWQAKHIWAYSLKSAEINSKRHRFLKEENQVDFSDKLSLAIQMLTSSVMQKTYCEGKQILVIDDGNAHPKWVTPFFRGSLLHVSLSLCCFQNLTASVKQIAEFFGFFPTAEQIQSIADSATFQAVDNKAEEIHGAVGSILFRKGKFVCILPGWWMIALHLGQTGIWISRWLIFLYNFQGWELFKKHWLCFGMLLPFGKALCNVISRSASFSHGME